MRAAWPLRRRAMFAHRWARREAGGGGRGAGCGVRVVRARAAAGAGPSCSGCSTQARGSYQGRPIKRRQPSGNNPNVALPPRPRATGTTVVEGGHCSSGRWLRTHLASTLLLAKIASHASLPNESRMKASTERLIHPICRTCAGGARELGVSPTQLVTCAASGSARAPSLRTCCSRLPARGRSSALACGRVAVSPFRPDAVV